MDEKFDGGKSIPSLSEGHVLPMSGKKATITAAWIGGGATVIAALIGTVALLHGGDNSSGNQLPSPKTIACEAAQKAVGDEINALKELLASLTIKDVGTADATTTKINKDAWNDATTSEDAASKELIAAIGQLQNASISVDPAVDGRLSDLTAIIQRLPNDVATRSPDDGRDTRALSDHRDHFQRDIYPAICSGATIPNA